MENMRIVGNVYRSAFLISVLEKGYFAIYRYKYSFFW